MIVFTDLDGTLLDSRDFSFEAALPTLRRLRELAVPVIPVTSKTLAEIEPLSEMLGLPGPFIIESGSAIATRIGDSWDVEGLGVPASELRSTVAEIERRSGARILLYSTMSEEEASLLSGLSGDALWRSMQRCYDEPFLLGEGRIEDVTDAAADFGLSVHEGGRFHHLTGSAGKGEAVQHFLRRLPGPRAVFALGDAPMDADFLRLADVPIVIRGVDGLPNPALLEAVPHAVIAPAPGPAGWAEAIEMVLHIARENGDALGYE